MIANEPVVLFALEWCEFCWSVRKLFRRLNIEYRSIDLDSVSYQQDDRGGKIRAVLAKRIGSPTIPQVFIAGQHVGGATELFDAMRDGSMQALLLANDISFDADPNLDPYTLLNLSTGIEKDDWSATLYIHNVTDENANMSFNRERGGRARLAYFTNPPRTIGVTFRKSFQ